MLAIDQPYALLLVFSVLIPAALTVSTLRHRPNLGARSFAVLLAAVALWAFVSLFEVCSRDPLTKIFSYHIKYLFIVSVPPAWLIFSLHYSNRIRHLSKKMLGLLAVIPTATLAAVSTNLLHHLMFERFEMVAVGRHNLIYPYFGPLFWLHTAYSYSILSTGFFFLARYLITCSAPFSRQVYVLIFGGLVPWLANIFFIFKLGGATTYFDFTPIAFTVSGIAFMWGILRYKLLDMVPIARDVVVQNMQDGILVVDNDENIIDINQAALSLLRKTPPQLIGKRAGQAIPWWRSLERFQWAVGAHPLPIIEIARDNCPRFFQLNRSALYLKNQVLGSVITLHDVTESQNTQRALQQSEARFKALSENAPLIVFSLDEVSAISYVNPVWEELLGYDCKQVQGKAFGDFVLPEYKEETSVAFRHLIDGTSSVVDINIELLHADGSRKLFNTRAAANSDSQGRVSGIIGLAKDITEEQRLQSQLIESQKMEAMGTLAGGIAHDFNNLLMGIQANLSLMRLETPPHPSFNEKFQRIEAQIQSGASLTRQLLGYVRKGKSEPTVFDLNVLIHEALNLVQRTNKGIVIHQDFSDQPASIKADKGQMELVLLNLLINAMDAMPQGGELSVTTAIVEEETLGPSPSANEDRKTTFIRMTICDTGVGMDPMTQKRIFEPFFTTKEMGRGTGLGLASVYAVIRNHDGTINVNSEPGNGTTFNVLLPAAGRTAQICPLAKEQTELPSGTGKILLVDDEPLILQYCREMIRSLGYDVVSVPSAEQALELYREQWQDIDLAVLDVVMPRMDGLHLLEQLKTINPNIRVILSTGYALNNHVTKLIACGKAQCLRKPYTRNELADAIDTVLDQRSKMAIHAKVRIA